MADLYGNFEELRQANIYGEDYHILMAVRPSSKIAFVTPHGGGVEVGCSELCIFSAGTEHSLYAFEGWKSSGNGDLHITSTNFDEVNGLNVIHDSHYTVSYHGYYDATNKNTKCGGMDLELKHLIYENLINAGFNAEIEPDNSPITGQDPDNLVNENKRGKGVQLELSTAQRNAFFGTNTRADRRNTVTTEFNNYVKCVMDALNTYVK
jgi:phage replication-related protein YjqB (UPF0714/DUF867 family)